MVTTSGCTLDLPLRVHDVGRATSKNGSCASGTPSPLHPTEAVACIDSLCRPRREYSAPKSWRKEPPSLTRRPKLLTVTGQHSSHSIYRPPRCPGGMAVNGLYTSRGYL